MVAVHDKRLPSALGKAEIPGEGESMSCINSDWSLKANMVLETVAQDIIHSRTNLFVTLWVSFRCTEDPSLEASCAWGAEFCVSSIV